jgi:hypothetical protein
MNNMLDSSNPRDALRAAIAERDAAAEAEDSAARAAVRAKSIVDDAEQMLALLAGVDDEITDHRASEIRAGERPSDALPPHLAAKKALKTDSEAKLSAARSAHEVLSKELVAASGRHHNEQANVRRAAGAVLSAEAPPLIEELHRARRTVWALEAKLESLSAVRYSEADGRSVLIRMPPDTFAAINETSPPALAGNVPKPYEVALARWNGFLQALTENPDSSLDSI